jgi:hypothetical protein
VAQRLSVSCEVALRDRSQRNQSALGRAGAESSVATEDSGRRGSGGDDGAERGAGGGVAGYDEAGAAGLADAVADGTRGGLADEGGGRGQGGKELETHDWSVRDIVSLGVRGYRMNG